jgi:uncharacterized DUF497 family protein
MFEWDSSNRDHVGRHALTADECEEAVADPRHVPLGERIVAGETRHGMIGRTESGRLLVVIVTVRGERFRVVTAWPAGSRHEGIYRGANR